MGLLCRIARLCEAYYSELTKTSTALARLAVTCVLSAARRLVLIFVNSLYLVLPIGLAGYKGYLKILFGCRGIEFGQFLLHPAVGGIGSIGHGFGFAEVGHGGQGAQEGVDVLRV